MTKIRIGSSGDCYTLSLHGHAGYHPGNDVVCAAISATIYALLGYLHNAGAHLQELTEETVEPGHVRLQFRGDEMAGEAVRMAAIGLLQIEQKYPSHVKVVENLEGL